jgi:hypothetical protein
MNYNWAPIIGDYKKTEGGIVFKGHVVTVNEQPAPALGNFICDQSFGGGTISAEIEFTDVQTPSACELIVWFDPSTRNFVSAGFGQSALYTIRHFANRWVDHAVAGDRKNLEAHRPYQVRVSVRGSLVNLTVDGVRVCSATLPFTIPQSQPGVWCQGVSEINIRNFTVERETPTVFVVMQFTTPFNELYDEVIRKVCSEFRLEAVRADETFGPGIIIADIAKQILDSKIIIADITPANPNVYYEVGYAHALNKPTILIAEKPTQLPFDVSPFRTLFYENSIRGKAKVEEGLRKHIQAILTDWYGA